MDQFEYRRMIPRFIKKEYIGIYSENTVMGIWGHLQYAMGDYHLNRPSHSIYSKVFDSTKGSLNQTLSEAALIIWFTVL